MLAFSRLILSSSFLDLLLFDRAPSGVLQHFCGSCFLPCVFMVVPFRGRADLLCRSGQDLREVSGYSSAFSPKSSSVSLILSLSLISSSLCSSFYSVASSVNPAGCGPNSSSALACCALGFPPSSTQPLTFVCTNTSVLGHRFFVLLPIASTCNPCIHCCINGCLSVHSPPWVFFPLLVVRNPHPAAYSCWDFDPFCC